MPLEVSCPNCGKPFRVGDEHAGKNAACPQCKFRFRLPSNDGGESLRSPPSATGHAAIVPPPLLTSNGTIDAPTSNAEQARESGKNSWRSLGAVVQGFMWRDGKCPWGVATAIALLAIAIGYFAGREHAKYEIQQIQADAGDAIIESMRRSLRRGAPDESDDAPAEPIRQVESPPPTDDDARTLEEPVDAESGEEAAVPSAVEEETADTPSESLPTVGSTVANSIVQLSLREVGVDQPRMRSLFGDSHRSPIRYLIAEFEITNLDKRKILNCYYSDDYFELVDDVENEFSLFDSFSYQVEGSLRPGDEILPESTVELTLLFEVPPPQTEYLDFHFDLRCLNSGGVVVFRITAEQIKGLRKELQEAIIEDEM